jgi:septal ring factor EnvC (AmiA/AmiB activator)
MKLKFLLFFLLGFLFLTPSASFSQTVSGVADQEAVWKKELEETEKEIAKWQDILNNTKKGTASLQREADLLNAKINEAKAYIKARNIAIERLKKDIDSKNKTIITLEQKILNSKESLASLVRKTRESDDFSLPEVLLTNQTICNKLIQRTID